ncbi:MAG TPA: hypothetical protein GXX49_08630 [Clostridiaceae bacterium]|nr:hypothetical protein [Clostridiaceae bacterium]
MKNYIAAYDLGTGGIKLCLVDVHGKIVKTAFTSYPLYIPDEGWAEQEPDDYWKAVCNVTKQVLFSGDIKAHEIIGIFFCTQWKGIIPIRADGSVLRRSIIWLDQRASRQAEELNKKLDTSDFISSDYWPKIMWIKENEPKTYRETHVFLEANAYLKYRACGTITSDLTSHFTKSCHERIQNRMNEILDAGSIDKDKFPKLVQSHDVVGSLKNPAASEMGLVEGIPVLGGCCDIPAIAVGTGATDVGDAHVYFGSSGWFAVTGDICDFWPQSRVAAFTSDKNIYFMGLESVGLTVKWILDTLYPNEKEKLGEDVYAFLENELREAGTGSCNLYATPSLYGENKPFSTDIRCAFLNLSGHHKRCHMARALLESICYCFRIYKDDYETTTGRKIKKVRAAGGCAQNSVWMQMLADILGICVEIPMEAKFAGTRGSACIAAFGLNLCQDLSEYRKESSIERIYKPKDHISEKYDDCFRKFTGIIHKIEEVQKFLKN